MITLSRLFAQKRVIYFVLTHILSFVSLRRLKAMNELIIYTVLLSWTTPTCLRNYVAIFCYMQKTSRIIGARFEEPLNQHVGGQTVCLKPLGSQFWCCDSCLTPGRSSHQYVGTGPITPAQISTFGPVKFHNSL